MALIPQRWCHFCASLLCLYNFLWSNLTVRTQFLKKIVFPSSQSQCVATPGFRCGPRVIPVVSSSLVTIPANILVYTGRWNQSIITAVVETWVAMLFPTYLHAARAGGASLLLALLPTVLAGKSCLLKTHFCCRSKCKASPWHQSWQWRLLERAHALFRPLLLAITVTWIISLWLWMYNFLKNLMLKAPLGHCSHFGHIELTVT